MAVSTKDSATLRLNRYLASCGLGSRRSCEELVREKRVSVNGALCVNLATRITPAIDTVTVDGEPVQSESEIVLLLNKPRGYICTRSDPQHRPTVYDLIPPHLQTLHHVGRLDNESQGLLVLTNSGDLTATLTHPKHAIEKEYTVSLNKAFDPKLKGRLLKGVKTPEGFARAYSIVIVSPRRCRVILRQGLKRQIRHMFDALGYRVVRLERIRIGRLTAPNLPEGKWRVLSSADSKRLLSS
ncbi:MAG: pseudouridine synthase [Verrucomicrobiota bacterium]